MSGEDAAASVGSESAASAPSASASRASERRASIARPGAALALDSSGPGLLERFVDYLRRRKQAKLPPRVGPFAPDRRASTLIVAGEHSGDLLGADLVQELKREGFGSFYGTGGDFMKEQGVELLAHVSSMTVIGFVEALKHYRRLKALAMSLAEEVRRRETRLVILIDYPGFNLRFAEMLRSSGATIVYVVSPQLWAWNYGRIEKIRANVDLMLPLFPFESEIYEREGVRSETIGHPLVQRLPRQLRREEPLPAARADARPVIALLPGSRRSEVTNLLEPMLDAMRLIRPRFPRARILLAGVEERLEPLIVETLARYSDLEVEYYLGRTLRIFEASDVVLIASGTATLEGAFFLKPMVMAYRVSWLNLLLISAVVRTRFIGIVNLLARRQTLIELLQNEANGENMARELIRILEDRPYRETMIAELEYVRRQLGRGNPAVRAAKAILSLIEDLRRVRR